MWEIALPTSLRIDALVHGLPQSTISPLQRVQNAAPPVTLSLSSRDPVCLALKELYWMPVTSSVFKGAIGRCPQRFSGA